MDIGMLWFDNDNQTDLPRKIENAADYYLNKYGIRPNVCFINPCMTPQDMNPQAGQPDKINPQDQKRRTIFTTGNIEVRTSKSILPNHMWIGINGSKR
jgi:hypothetical protein